MESFIIISQSAPNAHFLVLCHSTIAASWQENFLTAKGIGDSSAYYLTGDL